MSRTPKYISCVRFEFMDSDSIELIGLETLGVRLASESVENAMWAAGDTTGLQQAQEYPSCELVNQMVYPVCSPFHVTEHLQGCLE